MLFSRIQDIGEAVGRLRGGRVVVHVQLRRSIRFTRIDKEEMGNYA